MGPHLCAEFHHCDFYSIVCIRPIGSQFSLFMKSSSFATSGRREVGSNSITAAVLFRSFFLSTLIALIFFDQIANNVRRLFQITIFHKCQTFYSHQDQEAFVQFGASFQQYFAR